MTETVAATKGGDLALLVKQWSKVHRSLRDYLAHRGVSEVDIEDILQDVVLKLLRTGNVGTDMGHFQAMAFTAAKWAVVDRLRLTSAKREILTDPSDLEGMQLRDAHDPGIRIAFQQAWKTLSKREQAVTEMRLQGAPDDKIADALNVEAATVRSIARRARAKMVDALFD